MGIQGRYVRRFGACARPLWGATTFISRGLIAEDLREASQARISRRWR